MARVLPSAEQAAPLGSGAAAHMVTDHRDDLDGLRGLAVLSVFAVHSLPHEASGGFIGVDVFFVLSGYLIGSLTLRDIDRGTFSVSGFYVRRLRRLGPALLTVLLACLGFAAWLAFPKDALEIGKHVMGGAASVSNLVLWREAGYFDQSSEFKPLLHLWSLGIEEQFYLLWPLLALALARARRHALLACALAGLASFALNIAFVDAKPKGTFFLPPTRFWELLMGVTLACWERSTTGGPLLSRLAGSAPWRDAFALSGAVLLVAPVWLLDGTARFPGWWALLPTLGTVLVIVVGPSAWLNRVVLVNPVLAFYGRISYALYLWHWPLLTFPKLLDIPLDIYTHTLVVCASVILATLTYYKVERPIRFGSLAGEAPRIVAGALLAVAALGYAVFASDGLLYRYPEQVRAIAQVQVHTDYEAYRVQRCFLRSEQGPADFAPECVDVRPGRHLALWGDSHAAALFPGLEREAPAWGLRLTQLTAAACPPLPPGFGRDNPHCDTVSSVVRQRLLQLHPQTVVLAANWRRYVELAGEDAVLRGLRESIESLRGAGVDSVIVVGPLPRWRVAPPRQLLAAWRAGEPLPERGTDALDEAALKLDETLGEAARTAGARHVSAIDALCDLRGCLMSVQTHGRVEAVAFDSGHLTVAGSTRMARVLVP